MNWLPFEEFKEPSGYQKKKLISGPVNNFGEITFGRRPLREQRVTL